MRRAHGRVHSFRAHLASKLHDVRIDRRDLVVFGHGDTMVAIPNEVRLADLVEAHRMRGAPTYGRHRWLPGSMQFCLNLGYKHVFEMRGERV